MKSNALELLEDPSAEIARAGEPPLQTALHAVVRFPITIIILLLLGFCASFVVAFSEPNSFRSEGMLLIRLGAREQLTPEGAISPQMTTSATSAAAGDELLILSDPLLHAEVVDRVGVKAILTPYDPRSRDGEDTRALVRVTHSIQAWLLGLSQSEDATETDEDELRRIAIRLVRQGSSIFPLPQSNTISVSFTGHDPSLAQRVAAAYLDVLKEHHRRFFTNEDKYSFVDERLTAANAAVESAREALNERREEDEVFDLATQIETLAEENQILEATGRLDSIQIRALAARIELIDEQLAETPQELVVGSRAESTHEPTSAEEPVASHTTAQQEEVTPLSPDTAESLRLEIREERDDLEALGDEYARTSEYYLKQSKVHEERISTLNERLIALLSIEREEREAGEGAGGTGDGASDLVQINPIHTSLVTQRYDAQQEREGLQSMLLAREEVLTTNRTVINRLVSLEPTYEALERTLADAMARANDLKEAQARVITLRLIDADERMGSLRVVREPMAPTRKEGPSRLKILALGSALGLLLGLAIALARHLLDDRLHYPASIEEKLGVRVLGVVPESRYWRVTGEKLRRRAVAP